MPEVVYAAAVSLDGYLAPPDGSTDWRAPYERSDSGVDERCPPDEAVIIGRHTAEAALAAAHWPWPGQTCIALARSHRPAARPGLLVSAASPAGLLAQLHADGLRRVRLAGGGTLAAAFQAEGLIDELLLTVVPVLLGAGRPLFGSGARPATLRLVHAWGYPNGSVRLHYRCRG